MQRLSGLKQNEIGQYYFDSFKGPILPEMPTPIPVSYRLAHMWDWDGVNPSIPRKCLSGCGVCT